MSVILKISSNCYENMQAAIVLSLLLIHGKFYFWSKKETKLFSCILKEKKTVYMVVQHYAFCIKIETISFAKENLQWMRNIINVILIFFAGRFRRAIRYSAKNRRRMVQPSLFNRTSPNPSRNGLKGHQQ